MQKADKILTSHEKFHINLGLDRIEKILSLLDNPQNNYKIIHIAGTNGKGSTSKIINDILIEHFKKTETKIGLFTSPHLFSYTERIKINNVDISDYIFDKLIFDIDKFAKKNNIELSEFELITTCAFYYFYIKKVDYVVLETGLGGLYDATNVVNPIACAITAIDFDHTERLGKTIEEIALQKAGIIKKNSLIAISKDNLGYETIKNEALKKNAKLIELKKVKVKFEKKNYAYIEDEKFEFGLLGEYQAQNLALALGVINTIIKPNKKTVENALKNVKWIYRLQYDKEKNLLIDCAHNPNGIKGLCDFLNKNFKETKKTFVFGCLKNKDYKKMLEILFKVENSEFYFCEFDYPNSLKMKEAEEYNFKKFKNLDEILKKDNLKIFCGSIYMLGKIFG